MDEALTLKIYNAVFYGFAALAVGGAVTVALSQNIVRSAFALLATLFGVGAMYACAGADFLAATQLLIYVGGILVLLIFAVMLTHRISDVKLSNEATPGPLAVFVASCVLFSLLLTAFTYPWKEARRDPARIAGEVQKVLPAAAEAYPGAVPAGPTAADLAAVRPALVVRLREWTDLPEIWADEVLAIAAAPGAGDADALRFRLERFFANPPLTPQIGRLLLGRYLLPFEVVSILLLGALVGAAYLARKELAA